MKKLFFIIPLFISTFCIKINADAQVVTPIPPIVVTRLDPFPPGVPGNAPVPLTVTLKKMLGPFVQSQSKTFNFNNQTQNFTLSAALSGSIQFNVSIDGLSNQDTYYLPTVVNQETLIPASDCGMKSISKQYGYSVSIKCTGPGQYVVSPTKFLCFKCVPCDPSLR